MARPGVNAPDVRVARHDEKVLDLRVALPDAEVLDERAALPQQNWTNRPPNTDRNTRTSTQVPAMHANLVECENARCCTRTSSVSFRASRPWLSVEVKL